MAGIDNLTPFTKDDGRAAAAGHRGKGVKHLSTHIQELLNDESFTAKYLEGYDLKETNGPPIKAIVRVAAIKAIAGDTKWADWLGKYGYGTKLELANNPENPIGNVDVSMAAGYAEYLKGK